MNGIFVFRDDFTALREWQEDGKFYSEYLDTSFRFRATSYGTYAEAEDAVRRERAKYPKTKFAIVEFA